MSKKTNKVDVIFTKQNNGFVINPDNVLNEKQQAKFVALMLGKKYDRLTVTVKGKKVVDVDGTKKTFNHNAIHVLAISDLEMHLSSTYYGTNLKIECVGYDLNNWKLKANDSDISLTDELQAYLTTVMQSLEIDYMKINWDCTYFKQFFPVDNLVMIQDTCDTFDDLVFLEELNELKLTAEVITESCLDLAEFYNDEKFLKPALECEDTLELFQSIASQNMALVNLFETQEYRTDEMMMLLKSYNKNVKKFERMYPDSSFSENIAVFDEKIRELEEEGLIDEEIMWHFTFPPSDEDAKLFDHIDISYPGPLVYPGMENVTTEDWKRYLEPEAEVEETFVVSGDKNISELHRDVKSALKRVAKLKK